MNMIDIETAAVSRFTALVVGLEKAVEANLHLKAGVTAIEKVFNEFDALMDRGEAALAKMLADNVDAPPPAVPAIDPATGQPVVHP